MSWYMCNHRYSQACILLETVCGPLFPLLNIYWACFDTESIDDTHYWSLLLLRSPPFIQYLYTHVTISGRQSQARKMEGKSTLYSKGIKPFLKTIFIRFVCKKCPSTFLVVLADKKKKFWILKEFHLNIVFNNNTFYYIVLLPNVQVQGDDGMGG